MAETAADNPHPVAGALTRYLVSGRLAQLGERLVYTQEVGGSTPSPPIPAAA